MTRHEGHAAPKKTGYEDEDSGGGTEVCPRCGQSLGSNRGLEQFLGKLGISDEMINNLRTQMQNLDIEEYLNTAREYLKSSSEKARTDTKENPSEVAVGVAVLALGLSLIWSSAKQARTEDLEDRFRQLELKRALAGPTYKLDEVLSGLGITI